RRVRMTCDSCCASLAADQNKLILGVDLRLWDFPETICWILIVTNASLERHLKFARGLADQEQSDGGRHTSQWDSQSFSRSSSDDSKFVSAPRNGTNGIAIRISSPSTAGSLHHPEHHSRKGILMGEIPPGAFHQAELRERSAGTNRCGPTFTYSLQCPTE